MTVDNARRALLVASSATFLSFLDATVTNLAVPPVANEFDVSLTAVAWIATSYVIPFAALLAPAGVLADAVGARPPLHDGCGGLHRQLARDRAHPHLRPPARGARRTGRRGRLDGSSVASTGAR